MARSTWVVYAFEWGELLKCHLKGKTCRILADRILIILKKENGQRASSAPIYHNIQTYLLVYVSVYRTIGPLVC